MSFHIAIVVKPVCGERAMSIGAANAVLPDTPTRRRRRCRLPNTIDKDTMWVPVTIAGVSQIRLRIAMSHV